MSDVSTRVAARRRRHADVTTAEDSGANGGHEQHVVQVRFSAGEWPTVAAAAAGSGWGVGTWAAMVAAACERVGDPPVGGLAIRRAWERLADEAAAAVAVLQAAVIVAGEDAGSAALIRALVVARYAREGLRWHREMERQFARQLVGMPPRSGLSLVRENRWPVAGAGGAGERRLGVEAPLLWAVQRRYGAVTGAGRGMRAGAARHKVKAVFTTGEINALGGAAAGSGWPVATVVRRRAVLAAQAYQVRQVLLPPQPVADLADRLERGRLQLAAAVMDSAATVAAVKGEIRMSEQDSSDVEAALQAHLEQAQQVEAGVEERVMTRWFDPPVELPGGEDD